MKDPLVYEVLERMEQEKLSKGNVCGLAGVSLPSLNKFLTGGKLKEQTRQVIEAWMEPWLAAKEILG